MVEVPESMLEQHGAVSEEVAIAMATGACEKFGADYGLSVTGFAGPGRRHPFTGWFDLLGIFISCWSLGQTASSSRGPCIQPPTGDYCCIGLDASKT